MSLALMHKIAANSDIQKRTYEYSLWFCNHSVNLHEIFLHRTNSKSLYLGGIYIFFSYLSRLSVGFLLFSAPMCISLTFCNPECRRKNSSAKSKQGKIEDMHSWRCFPLGAIHIQCDKSASAISRGFVGRLRGQILAWGWFLHITHNFKF